MAAHRSSPFRDLPMIDFLFRRDNPSNAWERDPNLDLKIELHKATVNGISIGAAADKLSFLGRSSSKGKSPLDFKDLGFSIDYEDDGSFSGFQIVLLDPYGEFTSFSGTLTLNNAVINPAQIVAELGEPFWIDKDAEESILFYEFPSHEIQIEQSPSGVAKHIVVSSHHQMAESDQRKAYGVTKSWPPF